MSDMIKTKITKLVPELVEIRRHLHMHPELGFEEIQTAKFVAELLRRIGISPTEGVGKTGVVGLIEGKSAGKTILIRADMDALPIEEQTEVEYKSRTYGKMHACGHDGHMAILLGAATILQDMRSELNGNVKLVFQPCEESITGAQAMIDDGVLDNPKVDAAIALHGWSGLPLGQVGLRSGVIMASADSFNLTITGKGGHAAYPQDCIDPIYIGSLIIQALQGLVSRESSINDPAVVTIAKIDAGTSHNIIPETAKLYGTVRTLNESKRQRIKRRLEEVIVGITKAFNAKVEIEFLHNCPATINDTRLVQLIEEVALDSFGPNGVGAIQNPSMGAEDFSYFAQKVPSVMFHLGLGEHPICHNPSFDFVDETIPIGVEVFVKTALKYLGDST